MLFDEPTPRAAARLRNRGYSSWADYFWARIDRSGGPDACWEWTKSRLPDGYGLVSYNGKVHRTHCVAWMMTNGPIPPGKEILHSCDNPPCCNPAHLKPGTHADNIHDMIAKGRQKHSYGDAHWARTRPDHLRRGSRHGRAKLTEDDVRRIRERYAQGGLRLVDLAAEYGVAFSTIAVAIRGVFWTHVDLRPGEGGKGKYALKGAANPLSKLTAAQEREIVARYARGDISRHTLASEYGVSDATIGRVTLEAGLRFGRGKRAALH